MAEPLLLPLVHVVVGKAANALVETVTRMCGLDDDRRTLERQLLAIECKLANAEERSKKNRYVKSWMKELRFVAYEADNVLDDFQYEALHRQLKIGSSTTHKVLSYITHRSPLLFRFEMSKKLKNVLKKINKLVEEMTKFELDNSVHRAEQQHPWRQTHSKLDYSSKIFGRDDDKERVVKLLLDQQYQRKVQVLPIFGMGGLGKTTLAKMVYNDQEIQQHFQLTMWHCVSDNFDVIALVKSIIELATNGSSVMPGSIELLQKKLEEVIGQKRFLLVLDDVWNEDKRMWEDELKPLLCSVGGPGSVIVVTCRSKKVSSIMYTVKPHELVFLSEEDSWELFSNKAFSNVVDEQAELVTVGRRIVNKCKGLPLALKTMGGLLSSKQQVQQWKAIEETNIGDNDGGKYEVMPILKLSYKYLSSEMKQCFAFCAIFPKDYEMEKDRLIQLWMANGFIQEEGTMNLTERGEFIFDELVWRSFLQDKKVVTKFSGYPNYIKYEKIVCKMHDLMHDLSKDVTDECATIEELTQQKALLKYVCHMQMSNNELERISLLFKGGTYLRTLLAPSESRADGYFLRRAHKNFNELLQVSASLRALCCPTFSIVICKAINAKYIRYLDISRSDIVTLPNSVCMLYNLQTLRLIGCKKLQQLPGDMAKLRKLIHLHLSGCYSLKSMSPNFGLLNNLQILTTFVVDSGDGLGIEQLKDLQHLSNRLELMNLSKIKSGDKAKEAKLSQKQNLSELLFSWDQKYHDKPKDVEEVLQCLEPHSNIQKLEMLGYSGLEVPQWIRKPQMFNCLRELKISDCLRCKSIPVVWLSVSLRFLSLQKMENLTTLCNNLDVEGGGLQIFPMLKRMELIELPSLKIWAENILGEPSDSLVTFPMLEELTIKDCRKLASIPNVSFLGINSVQRPLEKLKCLVLSLPKIENQTTSCNNLDVEGGGLQIFPRLKRMELIELPSLEIWAENILGEPSDSLVTFSMLEELTIKDCRKPTSIPNVSFLGINRVQRPLEKLKCLVLEGPNSLDTSSGWSRPHLMVWKCFSFLEVLKISDCSNLVRWPTEELRCLDRLHVLRITVCDNLEANTSSSRD